MTKKNTFYKSENIFDSDTNYLLIFNLKIKGGTRGGKDQFSWEQVKTDKDRECYLGHSVMAPGIFFKLKLFLGRINLCNF